jgi:hypothetical protein
MSKGIVASTALVFACGLLASAAVARHARTSACTAHEGTVSGYLPTAARTCGTVTVNASLFRVETLHTGTIGQFTFQTFHLHRCRESSSTADVILPSSGVAILHLHGVTWCRHDSDTDPKTWLKTRNAVIKTTGTIVGLALITKGVTVKVTDGTASVTSLVTNRTVALQPDQQLFVPFSGSPGKPAPIALTPDDQIAVSELQSDVVGMGAAQVRQHLVALSEKSAVVIGDTAATIKRTKAQLRGVTTDGLTVAQVQQDPTIITDELTRLGTQTVVTAGAFDAISPVWDTIRSQAPSTTDVVYVIG